MTNDNIRKEVKMAESPLRAGAFARPRSGLREGIVIAFIAASCSFDIPPLDSLPNTGGAAGAAGHSDGGSGAASGMGGFSTGGAAGHSGSGGTANGGSAGAGGQSASGGSGGHSGGPVAGAGGAGGISNGGSAGTGGSPAQGGSGGDSGTVCASATTGSFTGPISTTTPRTIGGYLIKYDGVSGGGDALFDISCDGINDGTGIHCPVSVTTNIDVPADGKQIQINVFNANATYANVAVSVVNH